MTHEILEAERILEDILERLRARNNSLTRVMNATATPTRAYDVHVLTASAGTLAMALAGRLSEAEVQTLVPGLTEAEARDANAYGAVTRHFIASATLGRQVAELIVNDLTEAHERGLSAWWGTPLGRACGWWLGGPDADGPVATSTAAAILGMTRQSVHEARNKGRMDLAGPTGVSAAAVRAHMRSTYPLVIS